MARFTDLPIELHISHIATQCDQPTLLALSSVSRFLRHVHSKEAFKNIAAEQTSFGMERMLRAFKANKGFRNLAEWPQFVKEANFVLWKVPERTEEDWNKATFKKTKQSKSRELFDQILDCIWSMKNLKTLRLSMELPFWMPTSCRPALTIEHLDVNHCERASDAFLAACDPSTVKSLKIRTGYIQAAEKYSCLRRLHLTRTRYSHQDRVSLSGRFVKETIKGFSQLEWLVLDDTKEVRDATKSELTEQMIDGILEEYVSAIEGCPNLRYFAFSLRYTNFEGEFYESLEATSNGVNTCEFYLGCAEYLATEIPRLEQVCILDDFPNMYRAVRQDGEVESWEETFLEEDRLEGFPFDLLDPSLDK